MKDSSYRSHEGRRILESWQRARIGGLTERPVRSDLGVSVVLESAGAYGTPMLAIPGAGFPAVLLAHRLAGLAQSRPLLTVEAPGHPGLGLTTRPDPRSDDLATWVDVLLDGLGVEQADVFGHASGGWVALRAASERPDRVRRLVLAAPAGVVRAHTPLRLVWRSLRWRARKDELRSRRVIETVWGGGEPAADLVEWTTLLARHTRTAPPPPTLSPPVLRAVEQAVLVLVGERDPVFPVGALRAAVRRHLPGAQVEVVADAGHVLPVEVPDAVVRSAGSFLI